MILSTHCHSMTKHNSNNVHIIANKTTKTYRKLYETHIRLGSLSLILKTALCCRLHFEFINYPHSVNRGFHLTSRLVTLGWLFFSDKSNMNRYNIFREPCY